MPPIRELPDAVINQIAAGEVIERPSSAVKEMLENSIDAGSKSISIELAEGGRDLVRIVDDGGGIPADELLLAVRPHATSKLASADDLFRVKTLGFRGEALASIAGVSDFRIQSRPVGQSTGAFLEVRQGIVGSVGECGSPVGTQIEVRNLFATIPVRRKFLKTKHTELGHVTEAVIRLALAYPSVSLRLIHNERVIHERPADLDRRATIDRFFGREVAESLIPIESEFEEIRITGFAADPKVDRPNNRAQYLFVNGRAIRDRSLGHAMCEAYRGLIMTGRYPVAFLFIDMPADAVDVNVHPTKIEVRFQDPHRLYSQILAAIRTRFLAADLTARLRPPTPAPSAPTPMDDRDELFPEPVSMPSARAAINREFSLSASLDRPTPSLWPSTRSEGSVALATESEGAIATASTKSANETIFAARRSFADDQVEMAPLASRRSAETIAVAPTPAVYPASEQAPTRSAPVAPHVKAMQLHNTYLVVETPDGMLLVDQHALHERILYEEFRERVARHAVEIQELLVPEPVELSPTQVGLVLEQREVMAQAGLRVEEFGERCVLIHSVPAMLRRLRPEKLVKELAHRLEETGRVPSRDQMLEELLHMAACKAAVKAGDPLTDAEIRDLLKDRDRVEDSHHCPHGRPTVLRYSLRELEKQFKRV